MSEPKEIHLSEVAKLDLELYAEQKRRAKADFYATGRPPGGILEGARPPLTERELANLMYQPPDPSWARIPGVSTPVGPEEVMCLARGQKYVMAEGIIQKGQIAASDAARVIEQDVALMDIPPEKKDALLELLRLSATKGGAQS